MIRVRSGIPLLVAALCVPPAGAGAGREWTLLVVREQRDTLTQGAEDRARLELLLRLATPDPLGPRWSVEVTLLSATLETAGPSGWSTLHAAERDRGAALAAATWRPAAGAWADVLDRTPAALRELVPHEVVARALEALAVRSGPALDTRRAPTPAGTLSTVCRKRIEPRDGGARWSGTGELAVLLGDGTEQREIGSGSWTMEARRGDAPPGWVSSSRSSTRAEIALGGRSGTLVTDFTIELRGPVEHLSP
ncbi:MAG: hypothetical protein KBD01_01185 [Acidobacteria bacterium]|nr:hypothetical protein [Acidobacteriota bacterium]